MIILIQNTTIPASTVEWAKCIILIWHLHWRDSVFETAAVMAGGEPKDEIRRADGGGNSIGVTGQVGSVSCRQGLQTT